MKIHHRYFLIVFCIAIFKSASAQKPTGNLSGRILTSDSTAAAYATIELKKLHRTGITDENGNFTFTHLPQLDDSLLISSVQSVIHVYPVIIKTDEKKDIGTIYLRYNINQLKAIEVSGINHSYKSNYSFADTKTETPVLQIPQSLSAITKELIDDKMKIRVNDIVDIVPGVNRYSGFEEYSIRGFRAENAININGLRGYNTSYTSTMLLNVEKIEVIKGPVGSLYGNGDPGGTINLSTKKPLNRQQQTIGLSAGSWDHGRVNADITGPLNKNKTLAYRFNAGYDKTNSFRNQFSSKSYQLAPSLSFTPNNNLQLNADFSLAHISTFLDRGQPGFENDTELTSTPIGLMATQPGDFLNETGITSTVSLVYKINDHIQIHSGYLNYITNQNVAEHGVQDYITNDSVYLYYSTWKYKTVTNTFNNYCTFRFNTKKLSHQLLAGYDVVISDVHLDQKNWELPDVFGNNSGIVGTFSLAHPLYLTHPVNNYKEVEENEENDHSVEAEGYHTQGLYLQDQVAVGKWKFLAGIREELYGSEEEVEDSVDEEENQESVFLARLGILYNVTPSVSIYTTYNKGFDPFEASSAKVQEFDEPFKPVISELYEAGVKANLFNNKLLATIAVYSLSLKNVAVNANDISDPDLYVQRGEQKARGFEAEANGNILSNVMMHVSYAHNITKITKTEVPEDIGKIAENAPVNTSNTWIKYNFNKGFLRGFGINAGHAQVSKRHTLDEHIVLPGYCIINAGVQYRFNRFLFNAQVENITNIVYYTSAYNGVNKWPGAPRNFMFEIEYSF